MGGSGSPEGYSAGSWRRSPWTTCVPLDHVGPTVVLEDGMRVPASGAQRRRAPRSARSPGNRRARHLTREHVPLADVLAGQVTISRVRVRSRRLNDVLANRGASRHARRRPTMRDALSRRSGDGAPEPPPTPPGPPPTPDPPDAPGGDGEITAEEFNAAPPDAPEGDSGGPSRPAPAPQRPQRPHASHPGDALGRHTRNNPPDEEDPPEQTATTTFTPHVFKTTLNNLLRVASGPVGAFVRRRA